MELRQLRYFIAVAEAGSFSGAAQRLHISQPPLSIQVKSLEDDLGVRLFERGNRGVMLTAAGSVFLEEARAALARLAEARHKAQRAALGAAGMLAIGFVSIADYSILPAALKAFSAAYPEVDVQLHELTTDAQIREIRAARLDLGIGLAPVEELDLSFTRLLSEPLVLAVPSEHPVAARGTAADLQALAQENFIIPPRDVAPGLYDLITSHCRACGFMPRITQQARQMQTVISLVSSGIGIALVPASVQLLQRPGVSYVPLAGSPALVEIGLVRAREGAGSRQTLADNFARALQAAAPGAALPQ